MSSSSADDVHGDFQSFAGAVVDPNLRGRVLVVSARPKAMMKKLSSNGFVCTSVQGVKGLERAQFSPAPEVILFSSPVEEPEETLASIRKHTALRELPVLADASGVEGKVLRGLTVDDWIFSKDTLLSRLEVALRARRLLERDAQRTRRMELLLEITQAATSSLDLTDILRIAVEKVAKAVTTDRCSVVLVEGNSPRVAKVVASVENPAMLPLQIDLIKYPELRRSLERGQTTYVENASRDAIMNDVWPNIEKLGGMSILVLPLICQDDILGALFLRLSRKEGAFDRDDQEFVQAVAGAIANSVRNARLHSALLRRREDLESAYVDRYRELNEANRRLKEVNRFKDELLAVCSHDLRAPMQVLLGHGRLLLESGLTDEQTRSADAIVRQSRKIMDLVESLLDRGKGDQRNMSLDARMLDLGDLCRDTVAELQVLARERNVTLEVEGEDALFAIADEIKLREVLQNLVTNAIDHSPKKTRVKVSFSRVSRPDMECGRVLIRDEGEGVPADQLHLVFDRYRHGPGGTGLGLAICKDFVELHGGEVWAERPEGGGAAFIFNIPLAKTGAKVSKPKKVEMGLPRILIVEDDPSIAAVVEEVLRSRYRVEVARDGAEGLAKAKALLPDLVIMDVFLPRMDGLDAAVALQGSTDTAEIPIILLSAHQGVADKVKALELGAVDYLSKPFQANELLKRTEHALTLRHAELELARSKGFLKHTGRDPETGFYDRVGIVARLTQELSRVRRYGRPLTLAALKLKPAPEINLIKKFAGALREKLRAPDVLGHLGNGLFVVMMPECYQRGAEAAFARLLPTLEASLGTLPKLTCVQAPLGQTAESLLDDLFREVGSRG